MQCVSGAVNMQNLVCRFFMCYIHSFSIVSRLLLAKSIGFQYHFQFDSSEIHWVQYSFQFA